MAAQGLERVYIFSGVEDVGLGCRLRARFFCSVQGLGLGFGGFLELLYC